MRRKIPVPSGVCQAFYIGDAGNTEDLLGTFIDEYSADFFGEAASGVVDDAYRGVGILDKRSTPYRVLVVKRLLQTMGKLILLEIEET